MSEIACKEHLRLVKILAAASSFCEAVRVPEPQQARVTKPLAGYWEPQFRLKSKACTNHLLRFV